VRQCGRDERVLETAPDKQKIESIHDLTSFCLRVWIASEQRQADKTHQP
jgi:hypothetical protein